MKMLILLASICLLANFCISQRADLYKVSHHIDFIPKKLDAGSYNYHISGMAFDDNGFLWIAINRGLLRFDGVSFEKFLLDSSDRTSSENSVLYIIKTKKEGKLFMRTKKGNLYTIKDKLPVLFDSSQKRRFYYYNQTGSFPSVRALKEFNQPAQTLVDKYKWSKASACLIAIDSSKFLALGESNKKILLFNTSGLLLKEMTILEEFGSFFQINAGIFLVTKNFTTYHFDSLSLSLENFGNNIIESLSASKVKEEELHIYSDIESGKTYLRYADDLYELIHDEVANSLRKEFLFHIDNSKHSYHQILFDASSRTYFGSTRVNGFFMGRDKGFTEIKYNKEPAKRLKDPTDIVPYSVLKLNDSTVVTPTGLLVKVSAKGEVFQKNITGLTGNNQTIGELPGGDLIVAQWNLLNRVSSEHSFRRSAPFSKAFNKMNEYPVTLLMPEGDSVWVCTRSGIHYISKGKVNTVFFRKATESDGVYFEIKTFSRLDSTKILFSNSFGFYQLHTSAPFTIDTLNEQELRNTRHVLKLNDVILLSVYKRGLYIFKQGKAIKVPAYKRQEEIKFCHNSFVDDKRYLWVSTDRGMFKTTLSSILTSVESGVPPVFIKYADPEALDITEINGGGTPAFAELQGKYLLYPSISGLVFVNYQNLNSTPAPFPNTFYIDLDDKHNGTEAKYKNDTVSLSSSNNRCLLRVNVPYFGNRENLVIEYKYQDNWIELPDKNLNEVWIDNITAGYSIVEFRVRSGFEKTDFLIRRLSLYRERRLAEKNWFIPALIVLFFSLLFFSTKIYSYRVQQVNRKLEQQVQQKTNELSAMIEVKNLLLGLITHDMISPLHHISMLSNLLLKQKEYKSSDVKDTAETISYTCEKLSSDFRGIVSLIKQTKGKIILNKELYNLRDIVEDSLRTYTSPLSVRKKIILYNEIPPDKTVFVDHSLFVPVINNLISNAIKNTHKGEVRVFLDENDNNEEGSETILKIQDTGTGFRSERLNAVKEILTAEHKPDPSAEFMGGIGYFMIAELSRIQEINVTIESEAGKGTTVILRF